MAIFVFPVASASIAGGATEAKQDVIITGISDINTELDGQTTLLTSLDGKDFATETTLATLGTEATLSALNAKVTAVDTGNVTVVSSVLPTGAATETTLSALNVKVTACDTGNVTIASSALPTGAATEATLSTLNGKVTAVDTGNVTITGALPAGTNNIGDVDIVSSVLPTGAATETTLASIDGKDFATETTLAAQSAKLPATIGQKTKAASLAVTLASDEDPITVIQSGLTVNEIVRNDYTSTNVTAGAYVELIASTTGTTKKMQIFDSSGQTLVIATGAAASETDVFYVFPGGNGDVDVAIPSGTRVSIRAISATADVGEFTANLIG